MINKRILLTGVNTGIGFALSKHFLQKGAHLCALCRNARYFSFLHTEFGQISDNFSLYALDLEDNFLPLLEKIAQEYGTPDLIVNNAAVFYPDSIDPAIDFTHISKSFFVNVRAPALICRYFIERMHKKGSGLIVNMLCGASAQKQLLDSCAYRISKYALRELTLILAKENSSGVVKIVGLDPGWTKTRMGGSGAEREIEETVEQLIHEIDNLLGRSYG